MAGPLHTYVYMYSLLGETGAPVNKWLSRPTPDH